jgi:hypothetical protein
VEERREKVSGDPLGLGGRPSEERAIEREERERERDGMG